jgi:hypothetical protein
VLVAVSGGGGMERPPPPRRSAALGLAMLSEVKVKIMRV